MGLTKKALIFLVLVIFIVLNFLGMGVDFFTELLWFQNLNLSGVFWTIFTTQIGIRVIIWLFFAIALFINLYFTKDKIVNYVKKLNQQGDNVIELNPESSQEWLKFLQGKALNIIFVITSIVLAFLFSNVGLASWDVVLKFFNATPFDITDPVFGNDIAFYIFELPFYRIVYQLLFGLLILNIFLALVIYLLSSGILTKGFEVFKKASGFTKAKLHLSILFILFFVFRAIGYRLDMYNLLYSDNGVVFGAGYTDVNARMMALRVMIFIALLISGLIIVNLFSEKRRLILGSIVALFIVSFLLGNVYPAFVQQYQVEPNEFEREREYIEKNIEYTRQGYGLNEIKRREFPVEDLTYDDILENQDTVDNIRLWDHRALKDTYSQLQEIRTYYNFNDIDIDRYEIDGQSQQVMLSARELDQSALDERAQTWVNQKLIFTHGFGAAMSPVNQVTADGLPEFLVKDIPPKSDHLEITQPRIYYGEMDSKYAIVNTDTPEFDYPEGDENQFYNYTGDGGVKLDSFFKKGLFALKNRTINIMLNDAINPESRIIFNRSVRERVNKLAPFLTYDNDPYLAIDDNTGQMYWMLDAYTTSDMYPYSEPHSWGNYVRNSVKVTINAYTGEVDFYIAEEEPIVETYNNIFPELFSDFDEMSEGLKEHVRYPVDLFEIQRSLYRVYHMQNPNVFYNREDVWAVPRENYAGQTIEMEPYYTLMSLPKTDQMDFILMSPFTPENRNNIISWLGARSNPENYGELVLYNFPKGEQIYGPRQIESRIDQHGDISSQLSLWDQRGSNVIRGNLLVIPIANSLLYVEPIFLESDGDQIPELRKVIATYGDNIVMEDNLELALLNLFDIEDIEEREEDIMEHLDVVDPDLELDDDLIDLIEEVIELYQQAQQSIQAGDWAEYGSLQEQLTEKLADLEGRIEEFETEVN